MLQGIATVDTVNLTGKDDTLCTIYDKFVFNIVIHAYFVNINTPGRRQSKMPILSTNVDQKSLETEISIVICRQSCRPTGDK